MATSPSRTSPSRRAAVLAAAVGLLPSLSACGAGPGRFPLRSIVWEDHDRRPFTPRPEAFYSSYLWDGADNTFFRPASTFFAFEARREAMNVNALDEVPDSSWFTNRLSRRVMTPGEVRDGACGPSFAIPTPWTVVGGKPDGANPGFLIEDATGTRYLLKTEGTLQPFRAGAADAIGAALYHVAGYHAPCNRVVHFRREDLTLEEGAEIERSDGSEEPLTADHVETVLAAAFRYGDGRFRASVSRFIEGRPFGPWRYDGTRDGDPNDVFPHEHRRETRGMRVLASWVDHIDSRQENTLAAWIQTSEDGAGYVRHYVIDFGDCLGILHPWTSLARRFGHSGYLDLEHVLVDWATLGTLDRPWHHAVYGPAGPVFGYFDARRFVPDRWRPGYPNPAFERHTERDAAWMARILARVGDEHVEAVVGLGAFPYLLWHRELARILKRRRDAILERYLTVRSPLTWPYLRPRREGGAELCLQDLAVWSGIRRRSTRRYTARAWVGDDLDAVEVPPLRGARESYACAALPHDPAASDADPAYLIVDVVAQSTGKETTGPARVHLYQLGPAAYRVVGLERPEPGAEAPSP
ncbi:MAG: hypothetical protein ACFCGT_01835 [Sandaracinaceae bacterium]